MTDLGVIPHILDPASKPRPVLHPITQYKIERGRFIGAISVREVNPQIAMRATAGYVVRQLRVVFRQLWPAHGQRFPQ